MSQTPVHLVATSSQTVGPFFHFGLADNATLGCLVRADTPGERIRLKIRRLRRRRRAAAGRARGVVAGRTPMACTSVPMIRGTCSRRRASVDSAVCQPARTARACSRRFDRGRCVTRRASRRRRTSTSAFSPEVSSVRSTRESTLQATPALETDAVLALVPEGRRQTLLARQGADEWLFDIRLQGDGETVFFDL